MAQQMPTRARKPPKSASEQSSINTSRCSANGDRLCLLNSSITGRARWTLFSGKLTAVNRAPRRRLGRTRGASSCTQRCSCRRSRALSRSRSATGDRRRLSRAARRTSSARGTHCSEVSRPVLSSSAHHRADSGGRRSHRPIEAPCLTRFIGEQLEIQTNGGSDSLASTVPAELGARLHLSAESCSASRLLRRQGEHDAGRGPGAATIAFA